MGQNASSTNVVYLDNCHVEESALLGVENDGYRFAMKELVGGRIGIASFALGVGQAALEYATKYIKERKQFGDAIANFQGLNFILLKDLLKWKLPHYSLLKQLGRKKITSTILNRLQWQNFMLLSGQIAPVIQHCN